ncbi:GAP family protein [Mycobacterium intracellulare]|uniref:GAP family protein n=1 Tax=Mycobacterium intracellulare TaxID=1767 RepID=UPI001CD9DAED|nr:GAP family protein [Mycobacterium intracellulare]MCA2251372.1 GAP family protein [Mycobacterium intracellulare]
MHEVSAALLATLMGPALAMALSPIPVVIALVILIHNDQPRASSIAYLAGRATALTASALAVTGASSLLAGATHTHFPSWTKFIAVAVGAAMIVAGIRTWRRRSASATDPGWHRDLGGIRPPTSAAIGLLPPLLNPKVLAASAAAGTQITALSSPAAIVTALGCYVAVATSTVAAPVLIYLLAGARIDHRLERVRGVIASRQSETTAVTLIGIGAAIIIYGLARP